MGEITVTSLSTAIRTKRRYDAILSIEDPILRNGLRFHKQPHPDHLVLKYEDVDAAVANVALPDIRHVETALAFGREHQNGSLLIHCKVGIARSTATALAIIADRMGKGFERDAVKELLRIRPIAIPNLLILGMADVVLDRDGLLVSAWQEVETSDAEYASHRGLKREILRRNPALYSRPMGSIDLTAIRYLPHTLLRAPGLQAVGTLSEGDYKPGIASPN